jgi:hypothetical protein
MEGPGSPEISTTGTAECDRTRLHKHPYPAICESYDRIKRNIFQERRMKREGWIYSIMIFLVFCFVFPVQATVLDFQDNVANPPGFYGYLYYNNYTAGRLTDYTGKKVSDLDLSYNVGTLKPAYYFKLWDRTFSVNTSIPFGTVRSRNSLGEKERSSGLGDITVSPGIYLYENNQTGTFLSFWEVVSMPTGNWSEGRALRGGPNLGLHYWYLQHQLSFAQLLWKGKVSYDMNINYFQRFKEPRLDIRAGDSLEIEGILGYGITDKLRAGIYADYWTDVRDTKVDGTRVDDSKRKFFSIGPSITYGTEKWAVHFRFVPDVVSENGPKGFQTWLRFLYSF